MRYPLDPECPVVAEFMEALFGDPTMAMGAPVEDITEPSRQEEKTTGRRPQGKHKVPPTAERSLGDAGGIPA